MPSTPRYCHSENPQKYLTCSNICKSNSIIFHPHNKEICSIILICLIMTDKAVEPHAAAWNAHSGKSLLMTMNVALSELASNQQNSWCDKDRAYHSQRSGQRWQMWMPAAKPQCPRLTKWGSEAICSQWEARETGVASGWQTAYLKRRPRQWEQLQLTSCICKARLQNGPWHPIICYRHAIKRRHWVSAGWTTQSQMPKQPASRSLTYSTLFRAQLIPHALMHLWKWFQRFLMIPDLFAKWSFFL